VDWSQKIDQLTVGYRDSLILLSACHTGVFDALDDSWRGVSELASDLELDERALDLVLHALAAMGILQQNGDQFATQPGARPFLLSDSPDTHASIMGHNLTMSRKWVQLEEVLQSGEPAPGPARTERQERDFICGMENVSRQSSLEVVGKVNLGGARRLLDLGGGPGTAAITFAKARLDLHCVVYDLPGPVVIAEEQIAAAGLGDRIETRSGDFLVDELGENFDIVYISNIIHMLGLDDTAHLFHKAFQALSPGGRVMVKDFFLEDCRSRPAAGAQFSINMLVATTAGKSYTRSETMALLADAGFADCEVIDVAKHSQVLIARRAN